MEPAVCRPGIAPAEGAIVISQIRVRRAALRAFMAVMLAIGSVGVARAQEVITDREHLAFDRPEAWALQYFTSTTFLTPFESAAPEAPGDIDVQIEAGWIPSLSPAQQQVGFAGTKQEDLNKAPVLIRPRVRIALPHHFALTVHGVPPVRAFGVKPKLIGAALEWAAVDSAEWRAAVKVNGQTGTVTGAFTCPEEVLSAPLGSAANPSGCQAASSDHVTLRYAAVEFDVARRLAQFHRLTPHAGISINRIASQFQVDAKTFDVLDHTHLDTSGTTWSVTAGALLPMTSRISLSADVFYTPLTVRRVTGGPQTTDGLLNVRGLVSYRLR